MCNVFIDYLNGKGDVKQLQTAFTNSTTDCMKVFTLENMISEAIVIVQILGIVFGPNAWYVFFKYLILEFISMFVRHYINYVSLFI